MTVRGSQWNSEVSASCPELIQLLSFGLLISNCTRISLCVYLHRNSYCIIT